MGVSSSGAFAAAEPAQDSGKLFQLVVRDFVARGFELGADIRPGNWHWKTEYGLGRVTSISSTMPHYRSFESRSRRSGTKINSTCSTRSYRVDGCATSAISCSTFSSDRSRLLRLVVLKGAFHAIDLGFPCADFTSDRTPVDGCVGYRADDRARTFHV